MSRAIKYLENVSLIDEAEFGESIEVVSINEAIIACEIQELETLQKVQENADFINERILELNKKLKNIKIK